jgi:hypothetical protein
MKQLAEVWNAIGSTPRPRLELPESSTWTLGFRPALLDVGTMRIYPWGGAADECPPAESSVIAGFERGGFFYTRRAAARACREWGFGD